MEIQEQPEAKKKQSVQKGAGSFTKILTKKDLEERKQLFSKGYQFFNSKNFPQKKNEEHINSGNKIYKVNSHRNGCMTDPRVVQEIQPKQYDKNINCFDDNILNQQFINNEQNLIFQQETSQQHINMFSQQKQFNKHQQYGTPTPTKPQFSTFFNNSSSKKLVFEKADDEDIQPKIPNQGLELFSNSNSNNSNDNNNKNNKDLNLFNNNNLQKQLNQKGNIKPKQLFSGMKQNKPNKSLFQSEAKNSNNYQQDQQNLKMNLFSKFNNNNSNSNGNVYQNNNTIFQQNKEYNSDPSMYQQQIDFSNYQIKQNSGNNSIIGSNILKKNKQKYLNDSIQNDSISNIEEEDSVKSYNNLGTPPKSSNKNENVFQSPIPKQQYQQQQKQLFNKNTCTKLKFDSPPPSNHKFLKETNMETPQKQCNKTLKKNYNNDNMSCEGDQDNNYSTPVKFDNEEYNTPRKIEMCENNNNNLQKGLFNTPPKNTPQKYISPGLQITPQKQASQMKYQDYLQESVQKDAKYLKKKMYSNNNSSCSQSPNHNQYPMTSSGNVNNKENYSFDYDFEKEIGYGSFGSVWKCRNKFDHKYYAVKLSKKQIIGAGSKKEVLNEVQAMAKFSAMVGSENIVGHKNAWIEDGQLYHAMELCKYSLTQKQNEIVQFPESEIKKLLKEVCQGLQLLHKHNVGHLDIKPENILISFNNTYKIADLGLSRVKILKRGEYFQEGDSRYLAKELLNQPKQGETFDLGKCDIFSLGVSIYELMTRKKLQGNGQEWLDIREGILDFDNTDDVNTSNISDEDEEKSGEDQQIEQEVEETFEQQMLRMAKQNEKLEKRVQQRKQKASKLQLKENEKPIVYGEELKSLIKSMIDPDVNKRPTAEQILKSSYMLKNQKQQSKFEQKLNANLYSQFMEKKIQLKEALEASKIQRKLSLEF